MKPLFRSAVRLAALSVPAARAADADPTRVLPAGQKPDDARLGKSRDLNDKLLSEEYDPQHRWLDDERDRRED